MFLKNLRHIRTTLSFRLTIWYAAIFIFSSLILFALTFYLVSSTIRVYDQKVAQAKISEYALVERADGLPVLIRSIRIEQENNLENGLLIRLADSENRTLTETIPSRWKAADLKKIEESSVPVSEEQWRLPVSNEHGDVLEVFCRRLSDGSILQIGKKSQKPGKLLESFGAIFAGIMIPVVLVGITAGLFLALRALRPIRSLIQTVRCIDGGNLSARVPSAQSGDELDELVQLFNGMLGKIETLVGGMREALDNVAHDLRTPVTRLRSGIETALQSDSGAGVLREALMDGAEESERIVNTLDTLMDISEAEKGIMNLKSESTDIVSLVRDVADLYQYVAEDKGVGLSTELPEALYAQVDSNRIRQVVANLVDNAVKFTPHGGAVVIEATTGETEVAILVRDNGIGIPAQDLPRIFDRLFRGERGRSQRGLGLGLSMVQAVIRAHKGRIEVESNPGKGSTFTVLLPVAAFPPRPAS
ncbi:MAG TPA: HAMP domain-containing sensor histidine kinase [Desulfobacterales bacterium]|nr:HAMP domain-containing sensor histidine kinase [Desulfobacterales bacterium]